MLLWRAGGCLSRISFAAQTSKGRKWGWHCSGTRKTIKGQALGSWKGHGVQVPVLSVSWQGCETRRLAQHKLSSSGVHAMACWESGGKDVSLVLAKCWLSWVSFYLPPVMILTSLKDFLSPHPSTGRGFPWGAASKSLLILPAPLCGVHRPLGGGSPEVLWEMGADFAIGDLLA